MGCRTGRGRGVWRAVGAVVCLAFAGLMLAPRVAAGGPPCPEGSAPDRPARKLKELVKKCVYKGRHGALRRGNIVDYELYCPNRWTQAQAETFAQGLMHRSYSLAGNFNPVRSQFDAQGLIPLLQGVSHRYHYSCTTGGQAGVATHLKLSYRIHDPAAVAPVASSCTLRAEGGSFAVGKHYDREYRCTNMFYSVDPRYFVYEVSARLVERDLLARAREKQAKVCLLWSTNIQCAPCNRSDKLVVRMQVVPRGGSCLSDPTEREIRP